ncbi:HNH endonuclease [Nocardioides oleivorans]|uniref:HNH endonuclease n=1 Tax=Nocardioides oleivorans TaxID=273676 RepID=A0A4Q2RR47_9ACTN|nr:HNH endonuclease [Nocardioides oleivorans]RYB91006.1 HNH endonuclease [Nocardioides oleivorans]
MVREGLDWATLVATAPNWLTPFLDVPEDAAPPLWVSAVHPEAVESYGPAAIEWMEANLKERGKPLRLRFWQKLAFVLQLQHRADGTLCFRVVLESGPRRIGKSVRLRGSSLWRLEHGPELFEDEQLVMHTGANLAIVREVLRKAYPWAATRDGWDHKKGMTEPEISRDEVNRWVARSKDSTTGYDACLAHADECWDIKPSSIDDDLEPSMLERESPQLVLTSTAHRRATSLMPGRILDALTVDDGETLVLVWGAPADADPSDPIVWRAASPHWSEDRAKMMASKYEKAAAGEQDPEFDDLDPMQGFRSQYLNQWRLRQTQKKRGEALVKPDVWNSRIVAMPVTIPDAVALESWFGSGVSVAFAWAADATEVRVRAFEVDDAATAVDLIKASGHRNALLIGASLADDPAFRSVRTKDMRARVGQSVADVDRLLREDVLRHDGGQHLTGQLLAVRTTPGADGVRLASTGRADAVKAAAWAATAARQRAGRSSRMVVPKTA